MKLSLLTFALMGERFSLRLNADKLCKIAKDNGIDMLDLMEFEVGLYGKKNLKAALRKHGMTCGCIVTHLPFFSGVENYTKKLEKALDCAENFGVKTLMIIPGQGDEKACRQMTREEMLRRAVDLYTTAVDRASRRGITVGFENTPQDHKPLCAPEDCRYLLDNVPGLGFIMDTGNFKVADVNSDELEAYELLKDRLIRVHLKDVVLGDFGRGEKCVNGQYIQCVTTGAGIIPMEKIIRRLNDDGYDGVCTLEYAMALEVHGLDHARYLKTYVNNYRAFLNGNRVLPPYTQISGVDKPVSRIFFGTAINPMLMGSGVNALLDAVYASGINAFDCARGYGRAEKSLGSWIKARNNREKVVILTKCGNVNMKGNVCVNREVIEKELQKSLETLGTDYIDIYLLHRDDPNTPVSEFIDTLNEAKQAGKIRCFGVSNWTHTRIAEANRYAESKGLEGFTVSSPNYGLARQMQDPWGGGCVTVSGPENENARKWYAENGMPVLAYSSLGRGFFSGKFKSFDYEAAKKVLDGASRKGYLCDENMRRLRNAEELAKRDGTSVPQIAMRYIFGSDMNVFAIVSTTNPSRLGDNIIAALSPLSREDIEYLENDSQ